MQHLLRREYSLGADGSMQGGPSLCVPPACARCSCNWLGSGPVTRLKGAVVGGTMSWPVLPTVSVGFGPVFVTLAAPGQDVVHCGTAGAATRVISNGMGVDGMPASHGCIWQAPQGGQGPGWCANNPLSGGIRSAHLVDTGELVALCACAVQRDGAGVWRLRGVGPVGLGHRRGLAGQGGSRGGEAADTRVRRCHTQRELCLGCLNCGTLSHSSGSR